jgi:hypothetical protein
MEYTHCLGGKDELLLAPQSVVPPPLPLLHLEVQLVPRPPSPDLACTGQALEGEQLVPAQRP